MTVLEQLVCLRLRLIERERGCGKLKCKSSKGEGESWVYIKGKKGVGRNLTSEVAGIIRERESGR